jgi:iron(III) transport system ATP-binding protein
MTIAAIQAGAATLVLEDVSRRFGPRVVVDGVSFAAPPGQVTVLVGPSGCGKTTLLRMIAGIERPSSGRIIVDGREVAGPSVFVPPERRRIGLMFQDYALFPHLTVVENVLFGLRGVPRADRRSVAAAAIADVGLTALAEQRPGQLSGGEQQRLALARALAPSPRALLMDEPFSNLDRGLREDVRAGTLSVLRQAGVTTLIVTHDPAEALAIGDHLVLLDGGRVIQEGPAARLYSRPASLAAARALSDVNVVPGRLGAGGLETLLGTVPTPRTPGRDGESGVAAFRPEHLVLGPPVAGVRGRVEARKFLGASTIVTVSVAGLQEPLQIAVATKDLPTIEHVSVRADLDAGTVFFDCETATASQVFHGFSASSTPDRKIKERVTSG